MKICQIVSSIGWGGLERHFVDLVNGLAREHEVYVLAPAGYADRFAANVHYIVMPLEGYRNNPLLIWSLFRQLRAINPDIIHSHANKATAIMRNVMDLFRPLLSARFVATLHNVTLRKKTFARADRVIAVSQVVADLLPGFKVDVVYSGIAPSQLREDARCYLRDVVDDVAGLKSSLPIAVSVGRLVKAKGFDVLLEAWQQVPAYLVIVGDGPDREDLEQQCRALGLQDKVFFIGHRNDVLDLVAGANLFVIASRKEGGPYTLVEALHMRCLVVSTPVPVAQHMLPSSCIVPSEDPEALHGIIVDVLAEPEKYKAEFEVVWQRAQQELTLDVMVRNTIEVYRKA